MEILETERFGLQAHLDRLAREQDACFALRAKTREEFGAWQTELRGELARVLGVEQHAAIKMRAEFTRIEPREGYTRENYALDVGEGVIAPMFVLVPKREPPYRAILAFHGHDPGVKYILGEYPNDEIAREERGNDSNFAERFAQAGYLVCAVEQRGMGERLSAVTTSEPFVRSCRALAFGYMMRGRTLLGERVWDGMCALSYLQTREDVRQEGLGCTGHSGGGTTALFLAALDTRITAALVSGYFCSFADSILAMPHCECNYVPHVLELGEMGEIASLIAPRALGMVNGETDPIFPIHGTRAQFETVQRAYALSENATDCELMVHPGAHRYEFALAREWFGRRM